MEGEVVSVGQARGFDESYQACYGRLLRQVALVTADLADAEDVLQEAFARAAIRWRQLETDDAPEAWVLRVAMNLAADTTRRLRRRAAAMLRLGPPPTQPELSADSVDLIRALAALPLGQRQAIVLHHLVGRPVDEISRQLGVPSGTVKARLARGRTALARRLGTDFCPVHGRRLSMNDLQARLDRAADELTQAAIPPPGASGTVCHSWPGNSGAGSHDAAGRSWADRRCHPAPNAWAPGAAAGRKHPVLQLPTPWPGCVHLQRGNHQG